ncbi:MAG: nucleotidyltransferase domain-containing protein [Xanthomonadales bacterium]|nr:nucleotidyltransferase domain-containing protein [Xanthomonadales bacterium]
MIVPQLEPLLVFAERLEHISGAATIASEIKSVVAKAAKPLGAMPSVQELGSIVKTWAEAQPRVSAAYLYGSRVKGTHRGDSDLDVAVELLTRHGKPGSLLDWLQLADELKQSLGALLPVPLDLWQYRNQVQTPCVHEGLSSGSVLVYSNGPTKFSLPSNGP